MSIKRVLYAGFGLLMTGTGILGIFIPGLPTTVFILIALWAFSQSSPRLHRWLQKLPILRETMREIAVFQKQKNLPLKTKIISQSAAWTSCVAILVITRSLVVAAILGLAALSCSVFMYIVPTRPVADEATSDS